MDAESYQDAATAEFIEHHFIPIKSHIKEHPAWFHRFDAVWTPTVLLLDAGGKERVRLEGYLPQRDFRAALECGLGRLAFVRKQYNEAERWYDDVVTNFGESHAAAGAMYWRAVTRYSASHDPKFLQQVAEELRRNYPASVWASKAIPWRVNEAEKEVAD